MKWDKQNANSKTVHLNPNQTDDHINATALDTPMPKKTLSDKSFYKQETQLYAAYKNHM